MDRTTNPRPSAARSASPRSTPQGRRAGERAASEAKPWAYRLGYAAHGAVYLLIGALAFDAAFGGSGEQAQGPRGAIGTLASGTAGTVLLTILAIGLVGYAAMRLYQGFGNPAHHDSDAKGIALRIGRVASGLAQLALAFYALSLAYGWFTAVSGGAGGDSAGHGGGVSDLTARVMQWPAGRWIIGLVGLGIIGAAIAQLAKAIKASFLNELRITGEQRKWVKPLGRFGFSARFVVFLIAGGFVLTAAIQAEPEEAKGLGAALRTLQDQGYGPWLLGLVALGLIAFAIVRGVYARYAVLPGRASTG